jgi:23S rRNA (guanine2445-N2)-methyltransferase / 23S rRNA (guanine2069-N7)-methyltransferase
MRFFASTAKNIEPLLIEELQAFGATACKSTHLGVYFEGSLQMAYRTCLWSRLANHIFLELKTFRARDQQNLYGAVRSIDWNEHLTVTHTFRIDVSGKHASMTHPHFMGQVTKDAIVDQFRRETGQRPSIEAHEPDVVLHLHVRDEECSLYLDLSGESLHKRGLRTQTGEAPLKETLAAAILLRAQWPTLMKQPNAMLFDPCCGAGTLLIEGAMMAYDIAPGRRRPYFGFLGWRQHQPKLWADLQAEALLREEAARRTVDIPILGFDLNAAALLAAEANFRSLNLGDKLQLEKRDSRTLAHNMLAKHCGLMIMNPPYGVRLMAGQLAELTDFYAALGEQIREHLTDAGWQIGIFTGDSGPVKAIRMRPLKKYKFLNGRLDCELIMFEANEAHYWQTV